MTLENEPTGAKSNTTPGDAAASAGEGSPAAAASPASTTADSPQQASPGEGAPAGKTTTARRRTTRRTRATTTSEAAAAPASPADAEPAAQAAAPESPPDVAAQPPAKKATRSRKRAAAPTPAPRTELQEAIESVAAVELPSPAQSPAAPAETAPSDAAPVDAAPVERPRRRRRATATAASEPVPAVPLAGDEPVETAPSSPSVESAESVPSVESSPSARQVEDVVTAPAAIMPLFQAPEPVRRPRRAASRPAGPPRVGPQAEPGPEPFGAQASRTGARSAHDIDDIDDIDEVDDVDEADVVDVDLDVDLEDVVPEDDDLDAVALVEEADEVDDVAEAEEVDDETSAAASRRRRRRGGRGRRGRGRGEGDTEADLTGGAQTTEADAQDAELEDAEAADGEAADGEEEGSEDESGGGGSRRRRRRRRRTSGGGGDGETSPDDPPNTVVKVRESRRDDVSGVRGSTRLEAKKQRRREGREAGRRRTILTEAEFLARRESVDRVMVVREREGRTQIGVLEDGVLVEHYVARKTQTSTVGNVYLGKVQNVLPSMEAAFVDIGKGRNAVLYAGEVNWDAAGLEGQPRRIEHALKAGESVLVQVTKDPIGHKGARLTSQISLPGRYLVLVPDGSMTGISRKLPDTERTRLKKILREVVPDDSGVIVRTAAEGASEEELERDVSRLSAQWEDIKRKSTGVNAPALLYGEPDLAIRVVRDVFNEDFGKLVVSGDDAWDTLDAYIGHVAPDLVPRLERWTGDGDVFVAYRIDEQLAKALDRKVWLPSGGSLVIDRTEAMTVVDVNTGKFTGAGGNLEETVTKNNIEAAEEVVRQLRLRDIGGIIVVDFIDMVLESNRELVLRRLLECLGRDRTRHQVAEVTSLGLVQMTRKRVGQGLLEVFSETCEHCGGRGLILHDEPVEKRQQDSGGGGGAGGGGGRGGRSRGGRGSGGQGNSGGASKASAESAAG